MGHRSNASCSKEVSVSLSMLPGSVPGMSGDVVDLAFCLARKQQTLSKWENSGQHPFLLKDLHFGNKPRIQLKGSERGSWKDLLWIQKAEPTAPGRDAPVRAARMKLLCPLSLLQCMVNLSYHQGQRLHRPYRFFMGHWAQAPHSRSHLQNVLTRSQSRKAPVCLEKAARWKACHGRSVPPNSHPSYTPRSVTRAMRTWTLSAGSWPMPLGP